jgi:hypothetical protein
MRSATACLTRLPVLRIASPRSNRTRPTRRV